MEDNGENFRHNSEQARLQRLGERMYYATDDWRDELERGIEAADASSARNVEDQG